MLLSLIKKDLKYIKSKKNIKKNKISEETILLLEKKLYWCNSFSQLIYSYKNRIIKRPVCQYSNCNETCLFNNSKKYSTGCSHNHTTKINNMRKFGVENISQLSKTKQKVKKTSLDKFGETNIFKTENFKKNLISHNLKKYGVEFTSQRDDVIFKTKQNNFQKYGSSCTLHSEIGKQKCKETWIKKYGVNHFSKSKIVQDKKIETKKRVFLSGFFNKIDDKFEPLFDISEYTSKHSIYKFKCKKCSNEFDFNFTSNRIYPRCPICEPIRNNNVLESELFNSIDVKDKQQSNRSILNGKEIDIYIPSKKLAIEFNGIYWHSELNGKDKKYHLDKTLVCEKQGIQLLHIFETEWLEKQNIVKSIISAKLGKFYKRIYARKTQIKEIDTKVKNQFLEENHLQGQDKSSIKLGLFYNDELVSVMTFGKSRYNKSYEYEMHRFCNKLGHQIIGGASKLFKYFIKTQNPKSIITYADRRFSNGIFYEKIGFTKTTISPPNFFIINKGKLESRLAWQKHKLSDKLDTFDNTLTAWENLQLNGYDRIWDCGNFVYIWNR